MPKMGESITEGTIIDWLISVGDSFDEGDIILEVATDKVDNEVPAPFSGTLVKTLFQAKDVVPVGEVLAILEASGETRADSSSNVPLSAVETSQGKPAKNQKGTPISNDASNPAFTSDAGDTAQGKPPGNPQRTMAAIDTSSAFSTSNSEERFKRRGSVKSNGSPNTFNISDSNPFFSPLVIKIAREHHISFEELARIPARGHEGRLRKSDVFN
ncbi:MAG: biotin/lipoyl-containing protein, partial [Pricia sp.]